MANDLKTIYRARTVGKVQKDLNIFADKWDKTHPIVSKSWRNNGAQLYPFFDYPVEIRWAMYTTNAIESLDISLRKFTKNHDSFLNDETEFKLLYLALKNARKKWTKPIKNWKDTMNYFAILF